MGKSKFETRVREIERMNGQIVLQVLRENVHATADEIINHVAGVAEVSIRRWLMKKKIYIINRSKQMNPNIIKPEVEKILNEGVNSGFLFKSGFRYTMDPPELKGRMMTDNEDSDETNRKPSRSAPVKRSRKSSKSPAHRRQQNSKYV